MDELTKKFREMIAHIADLAKEMKNQQRYPVQRYNADRDLRNDRRPSQRDDRDDRRVQIARCYRCSEEGHYSKDCEAETPKKAQASSTKTYSRHVNMAGDWRLEE